MPRYDFDGTDELNASTSSLHYETTKPWNIESHIQGINLISDDIASLCELRGCIDGPYLTMGNLSARLRRLEQLRQLYDMPFESVNWKHFFILPENIVCLSKHVQQWAKRFNTEKMLSHFRSQVSEERYDSFLERYESMEHKNPLEILFILLATVRNNPSLTCMIKLWFHITSKMNEDMLNHNDDVLSLKDTDETSIFETDIHK